MLSRWVTYTLNTSVCLQDLNPVPFPIVIANCVAWVAYAVVNKDPYVFLANDPGILLGLFYTLSAYGYADVKVIDFTPILLLLAPARTRESCHAWTLFCCYTPP